MKELTDVILYAPLINMINKIHNMLMTVVEEGVNSVPLDLTIEALASLGTTFNFIDCWLKRFEKSYQYQSNMYTEAMQNLFNEILVKLPKLLSHTQKRPSLLHAIGGDWCIKNEYKLLPLNKRILGNKITRERGCS